jgi:diguanylate cyclase (GGDEF)-like protein/putative nucleotidyltransferase with HDIG domain
VAEGQTAGRWVVRLGVAGLLVVLCFLAGFAIRTQSREAARSRQADTANALGSGYQAARFSVSQEESLLNTYRIDRGAAVLRQQDDAEHDLMVDLKLVLRNDASPANRAAVARLLELNARYGQASDSMVRAVNAHKPAVVEHLDHTVGTPVSREMQGIISRNTAAASQRSLALTAALRRQAAANTRAIVLAFGVGLALLCGLGLLVAYFRRRISSGLIAEVRRLGQVAITDPLTGLRNHRAFQEDLEVSLHRAKRLGVPVSLVILDYDELKAVNDSLGHQAGDDRLKILADAIRSTGRGSDSAYRIGGDEFAAILDGTRAWSALEFTQRLNACLIGETHDVKISVTAGISERLRISEKDPLIREASLALVAAKRSGQSAVIYTPEVEPHAAGFESPDERHTRTLANALALAVDAKDSYTRSHSQTVSQLSALIATELGFDGAHVTRMRLAGLLHDVGKIGIPDAILNKPAKLTDEEYEVMKTHSVLGYEIVLAAGMPVEAEWIRHHHARLDGQGYPDPLSGEAIPVESRIIFVADSFEAMTSDRPYRKAPGQKFAIAELDRCSGTQFDPRVVAALCRTLEAPVEPAPAEPLTGDPASHLSVA